MAKLSTLRERAQRVNPLPIYRIERKKIAVIGSGSWATAIAKILLNNVNHINWYIRRDDKIEFIKKNGYNPDYLQNVHFDNSKISFYSDVKKAIDNSDIIFLALPSVFLKDTLEGKDIRFGRKIVVSAIKGIVPNDYLTITQYLNTKHNVSYNNLAIISGPCHAEEIAIEKLSYLTIGCRRLTKIKKIAARMECSYVKTFVSRDIYGIEYSAVLKNIVAIGAGICHGLGYGDNYQAVLVSNAIREMKRFLDEISIRKRQIDSSAYLGDLLVTAYSHYSRNRTFGNMIGRGFSVKTAQLEMKMIAEGYYATLCIHEMNKKYKVDIPIIESVYEILYNNQNPNDIIKKLSDNLH